MIYFFRDIIDGPIYIIAIIISLFGIMAIFGFMLERLKKKEERAALVKDVESLNSSKLVISSVQLEEEKDEERLDLKGSDKKTESVLELNSSDIITTDSPIEEKIVVNKTSNDEEDVLSINSSDVIVNEIVEEDEVQSLEEENHKVKDMTQVIDFGSTDSVEEEVEKI